MENSMPLHRGVRDHWIYRDSQYFHVWSEMLMTARYSEETCRDLIEGQIVELKYGEFIFGRKTYSDRIGISEQRLRTLVKKMVADGMIDLIKNYNKFSVYVILNYSKFNQHTNHLTNQQKTAPVKGFEEESTSKATPDQPAINQQVTTYKKEKKSLNTLNNKKQEIEDCLNSYSTNSELINVLRDFIEHRKEMKKPMTVRSLKGIMKEVDTLAFTDDLKVKIIEQSITRGWQGVFPLKTNDTYSNGSSTIGRTGQAAYRKEDKSNAVNGSSIVGTVPGFTLPF